MALQGTIETFALPEVLRLLGSGGKTGRLRVSGDRGSGSVWIDGGKVVGAEASGVVDGASPASVVFELLRFGEGSFNFDDDQVTTRPGTPQDIEVLLAEAERQLAEWQAIEAVIPSLDVGLVLSIDLPGDEIVIDAKRWNVIVAIAAGGTVRALAEALDLDELNACARAKELVEDGLVDVTEAAVPSEVAPPAWSEPGEEIAVDEIAVDEIAVEAIGEPSAPDTSVTAWVDTQAITDDAVTDTAAAPADASSFEMLAHEPEAPAYQPVAASRSAARAELDAMASGFGLSDPVNEPSYADPYADAYPESSSYDPLAGGPSINAGSFDHGFTSDPSEDPAFSFAAPDAHSGALADFASVPTPPFSEGSLYESSAPAGAALFAEDVVPAASPSAGLSSADPLFAPGTSGFGGEHDAESGDAAEVARQLANLSPKAARAVAAAARASTVEEREAALAEVTSEGNEPINRGLLLKFLSSVQS